MSETYLTRREAGDHLRLSDRTIDRLIKVGRLPVIKIGAATRIKLSELDRLAEASARCPATPAH
jgi:excisionase family DNA binding protein